MQKALNTNTKNSTKEKFPDKIIIGLTGASGSGKNELAHYFDKSNTLIIDADLIANKVLKTYEKLIIQSFKNYNPKIENKDASLNKTEFANLVFSDAQLLKKHEKIVLPIIEDEILEKIKASSKKIVLLNAPTLHKCKLIDYVDFFIYVNANYFLRMLRVKKRDKLSFREVFLRFKNQKNFYEAYKKTSKKIYIINNNFSKKCLEKQLSKLMEKIYIL